MSTDAGPDRKPKGKGEGCLIPIVVSVAAGALSTSLYLVTNPPGDPVVGIILCWLAALLVGVVVWLILASRRPSTTQTGNEQPDNSGLLGGLLIGAWALTVALYFTPIPKLASGNLHLDKYSSLRGYPHSRSSWWSGSSGDSSPSRPSSERRRASVARSTVTASASSRRTRSGFEPGAIRRCEEVHRLQRESLAVNLGDAVVVLDPQFEQPLQVDERKAPVLLHSRLGQRIGERPPTPIRKAKKTIATPATRATVAKSRPVRTQPQGSDGGGGGGRSHSPPTTWPPQESQIVWPRRCRAQKGHDSDSTDSFIGQLFPGSGARWGSNLRPSD